MFFHSVFVLGEVHQLETKMPQEEAASFFAQYLFEATSISGQIHLLHLYSCKGVQHLLTKSLLSQLQAASLFACADSVAIVLGSPSMSEYIFPPQQELQGLQL